MNTRTKPRDFITDQIDHKNTEYVPYTLSFDEGVDESLDSYYGGTEWRNSIQPFIDNVSVVETMKKTPMEKAGYEVDLFGSVWRTDLRPFHLEKPGLDEPSFAGYCWPDPAQFYMNDAQVAETARQCTSLSRDHFVIAWLGWGLFETSWGMRGFENCMMDMALNTSFYEELLDRATEQFLSYVEFTCNSLPDADAIMFGDDWGHQRGVMAGPDRWRKLFKSRYRKIYDAVHAHGKSVVSHCCGSVVDIMPDIIDIGLDVLESVQPEARGMDPYTLKEEFGSDITFWGCLGSQSTIPFGKPSEIKAEVRRLKKTMAVNGGFILAPAKSLQPGTPIENAAAVVESFVEMNVSGMP